MLPEGYSIEAFRTASLSNGDLERLLELVRKEFTWFAPGSRLHLEQTYTHPTTASIMPREMMFLSPEIFEQIEAMDRDRAMNPPSGDGDGAYIIATGFKSWNKMASTISRGLKN